MPEKRSSKQVGRVQINLANKYSHYLLPFFLMVVDYGAILCAETAAYELRNILISNHGELIISELNFFIVWPLIYIIFFHLGSLYNRRMQFWRIIARIFKINFYATAALVVMMYASNIAATTSRLFTFLMWVLTFIFIVLFRFVVKKVLAKFHLLEKPILFMGAGKTAKLILKYFQDDAGMGYQFVGYLEDRQPEPEIAKNYTYLGTFADAEKVIAESGLQSVVIMAPGLNDAEVQQLIYRLQPLVKEISYIPDMGSMPLASFDVESLIDGHVVLFKVRNNLASGYNEALKQVFDFVCTLIGTICISPLLLIIALWIYHDSPGPIIFKHIRVGKNGELFPCYKFRSMCVDADKKLEELLKTNPAAKAEWERDFKLKDDPRITKSGAFLRRTSLDELPQIFNVLRGEMSLVGPRPIISEEIPRYGKYIEDYYMVHPGITGMWQTSGRSDIDYGERVQMDTWYVRNWNVWFDVVLLWRTFKAVVSKKGAY